MKHTHPIMTDAKLRSMLSREFRAIRNLRWRFSGETISCMLDTAVACYAHVQREYDEMKKEQERNGHLQHIG